MNGKNYELVGERIFFSCASADELPDAMVYPEYLEKREWLITAILVKENTLIRLVDFNEFLKKESDRFHTADICVNEDLPLFEKMCNSNKRGTHSLKFKFYKQPAYAGWPFDNTLEESKNIFIVYDVFCEKLDQITIDKLWGKQPKQ